MKEDRHIKQQVEQTMQSLDGIKRAQTDDFFYTRLEKRLEDRKETAIFSISKMRLSAAVAALFALILLNVLTVLEYDQSFGTKKTEQAQNLEAFAEEYLLEVPTIYELNSNE